MVVFSTYVEVILIGLNKDAGAAGFLHVCGGDPKFAIFELTI